MRGQGNNKRRHQRIIQGKNNGLIVMPERIGDGFKSNGKQTKGKRVKWRIVPEGKGSFLIGDFKALFGDKIVVGQRVTKLQKDFTVLRATSSIVVVKHHARRILEYRW